jgi:hypothetical protein
MFLTVYTIIVFVLAAVYYVVQITRDVFFDKNAEDLQQKPQDEDIDISDEAGQFKPVLIERPPERPPARKSQESASCESNEDEPSNRRSVTDTDPAPPEQDEESKARIQKLVTDLRDRIDNGEKEEEASAPKADNLVDDEFLVYMDEEAVKNVMLGGQTAEETHKEACEAAADPVKLLEKKVLCQWEEVDREKRETERKLALAERQKSEAGRPHRELPTLNL